MSERARRKYYRRESIAAKREARADSIASFEQWCCEQAVRLDTKHHTEVIERLGLDVAPEAKTLLLRECDIERRR